MVINRFQDILSGFKEIPTITLPDYKESDIKIDYKLVRDSVTIYKDKEPALPFPKSEVYDAPIINSKLLTPLHAECKPVYEFTFDVKGSNFVFSPGDTIGIIPHNSKAEVNAILDHLEIMFDCETDLQYELSMGGQNTKIPSHVPVKSTLRYVFTKCLDIRSVVKKLFLLALSKYTKEETERKALEYLCSKEGSSVYTTLVLEQNICILDIFKSFKSCKPPVQILLVNLPRLLPRPYSIVNSCLKQPDVIKICFSVKQLDNGRKGLTTGWLEQNVVNNHTSIDRLMENLNLTLSNSEHVPIYLRKNIGQFKMNDMSSSIIMVATGTGIAPFISFLEERDLYRSGDKKVGFSWLLFGCRDPDVDYLYKTELDGFVTSGSLNRLSAVFSRVDHGGVKYVQHAILENGAEVTKLLVGGATMFLCGDHRGMVRDVRSAVVRCLVTRGGKTEGEAETFLTDMEKSNRYVVDVWS